MSRIHHAQIWWTEQHVERGLSTQTEMIDPTWFVTDGPSDGWSLICRFVESPNVQGNPSSAQVEFQFDEAPHERLRPGVELRMFERATTRDARVLIVD